MPQGLSDVSIHAPREGCDDRLGMVFVIALPFQFTHPGRGATSVGSRRITPYSGFNSRTPGGVRRHPRSALWLPPDVSIHAPREGCDVNTWAEVNAVLQVSIHAPREGCDQDRMGKYQATRPFQFTHPGRGATSRLQTSSTNPTVSIHAPREGCDSSMMFQEQIKTVSIHAPREGCDCFKSKMLSLISVSIHAPREGCDIWEGDNRFILLGVSIHAPREGCDRGANQRTLLDDSFNSRTPGGVRRSWYPRVLPSAVFQFTHPGRGATKLAEVLRQLEAVSIHAPREGCDL